MNKKKLTILLASAVISCGIGSFVTTPDIVEARELTKETLENFKIPDSNKKVEDSKKSNKDLKVQVNYKVQYIDDTDKKELQNVTKIDFANETVKENWKNFDGYKLVSEKTQTKILNKDNNEPIVFHYVKNDLSNIKIKAKSNINKLENIEESKKKDFIDKVNSSKSEESINEILEKAKKLDTSSKHQVKYQINYIDDTTDESLDIVTKIDFSGGTVTEKAKSFDGYELVSENSKTKTLNKDNKDTIVFHYRIKGLSTLKRKAIDATKNLKNIEKSKKDKYIKELLSENSEDKIKKISKDAKKLDTSLKKQVIYKIKYIDDTTGKELDSIKKIDFAKETVTEKAKEFKKYKLVSPETQSKVLSNAGDNSIEFHYRLYDNYISLDDFIKEKIDFKNQIHYEDTNFTGKSQELKDYIIKNIYKNSFNIKFKASEEDKEKVYNGLFNKTTKAGNVRFARKWETEKKPTDTNGVFDYTLRPSYLAVRSRQIETEEKIDEFIKKNIKKDMTDFKKAQIIHDYIINIATPAPGAWMTPKGNNVHETPALFLDGKGVCEAYAMAFNRLAERAGLESKMVVGIYSPFFNQDQRRKKYLKNIEKILDEPEFDKKINHAWNKVKINGKWYNVDTYHDDFRFESAEKAKDKNKNQYGSFDFLKSDEHFKNSDKIWNPKYVEKAEEDYNLGQGYKILTNFSK